LLNYKEDEESKSNILSIIFMFYVSMVISKKVKLEIEIEVDMPLDIIEDRERFRAIESGLIRSISKGLYEQGVSFNIGKVKFES
jgi:hypothetical protein